MSEILLPRIESRRTAFTGRLLTVEVQQIRTAAGRTAEREVVHHPGAVAVMAQLADGRLLFVRQHRAGVNRTMLEVVAGLRDNGESAAACARREVREETGGVVRELVHVGGMYPSPGYLDERIEVFFARLEARFENPRPDPDEEIEVCVMEAAAFRERIRTGEVEDAKTLAAWLLCEKLTVNENGSKG